MFPFTNFNNNKIRSIFTILSYKVNNNTSLYLVRCLKRLALKLLDLLLRCLLCRLWDLDLLVLSLLRLRLDLSDDSERDREGKYFLLWAILLDLLRDPDLLLCRLGDLDLFRLLFLLPRSRLRDLCLELLSDFLLWGISESDSLSLQIVETPSFLSHVSVAVLSTAVSFFWELIVNFIGAIPVFLVEPVLIPTLSLWAESLDDLRYLLRYLSPSPSKKLTLGSPQTISTKHGVDAWVWILKYKYLLMCTHWRGSVTTEISGFKIKHECSRPAYTQ